MRLTFALLVLAGLGGFATTGCTTFDDLEAGASVSSAKTIPCGTPTTAACAGAACVKGSECASGECGAGACTDPVTTPPPRPDDAKKNGDETDVDCGGSGADTPRCPPGQSCLAPTDCGSKVCTANVCAAPSATDKVQNGDETDVDCGGTTTGAPRCGVGLACKEHTDCESDGCDDTKKCAVTRSCTQTNGGLTCGEGEVGAATAKHESCCLTLPVPGMTSKLDKYKVTAGRMRAFIERTKGDVAGWWATNKTKVDPKAAAQLEGFDASLPTDLTSDGSNGKPVGANYQLGGFVFYANMPSTSQGCFVGNAASPANGAHTYWNGDLEGEDRPFDQAYLDRLPLNCVPWPLLVAFCAWDGGRLQTFEENSAAYGGTSYPWGNAPEAGGFGELGGTYQQIGPARQQVSIRACPDCELGRMNWASVYQNPEGGVAAKPWDFAYFISPPGRFPIDKGPNGHMDIGGLMMELTASPGATIPSGFSEAIRWSRAGSWEGHQSNYDKWSFPRLTKYGKTGGRCARD